LDPVIHIVIGCAFAVLWLTGAAHKATSFARFCVTLREYRLLPPGLARAFAMAIIGVEIALGIGALVPVARPMALIGSSALLVLYAVAIGVNLSRGRRHIDCGCMGAAHRPSLSGWLVWRNLALAAIALSGSLPVGSRELLWADVISIVAAVGVSTAMYAALNRLIANAPELARLRS